MTPQDISRFWLEETPPEARFTQSDDLDTEIAQRFGETWEAAAAGRLEHWLADASGILGYVVLTDQFPRNMFRGEARAFATDDRARAATKSAIDRGLDARLSQDERFFLYMPLVHSEIGTDQERGVRRMKMGVPDNATALLHARAHREVIRRFGRFPFRNAALGRRNTAAEDAFLDGGGYGAVVREMQAAA